MEFLGLVQAAGEKLIELNQSDDNKVKKSLKIKVNA